MVAKSQKITGSLFGIPIVTSGDPFADAKLKAQCDKGVALGKFTVKPVPPAADDHDDDDHDDGDQAGDNQSDRQQQ